MPRKSTTDAMFALRLLMKRYRAVQKELKCVFVDQEKAYDRLLRVEFRISMRKSGMAEKNIRLMQDMLKSSMTVVRFTEGITDGFKVEVGLH